MITVNSLQLRSMTNYYLLPFITNSNSNYTTIHLKMPTKVMAVIEPESQCGRKDGTEPAFLAALILTYLLCKLLSLMLIQLSTRHSASLASLLLHVLNNLPFHNMISLHSKQLICVNMKSLDRVI